MTTPNKPLFRSSTFQAIAVLLIGLSVTLSGSLWLERSINHDAATRFQHSVERVSAEILRRFRLPVYGLNGIKGMYAANDNIKRAGFLAYVESRDLPKEFPAVRGFGFIQQVRRSELDNFLAAERADGAPRFAIRQLEDKPQDDLFVIKFIEPAANNAGAGGLDIGSEPNRREAAQLAVDTGQATITAAITLVQDERKASGALMYVPIYASGTRPATVAERRAALVGLAFAPFVFAELLDGIADVKAGLIDFEITDSGSVAPKGVLWYDADNHVTQLDPNQEITAGRRFSTTIPLALPGREVSLRMNSTTKFDVSIDQASSGLVLVFGTILSGLLALLVHQQGTGRHAAERLAQRMTEQLRHDEARSHDFSKCSSDWLWETDAQHRFNYFSDNLESTYGLSPEKLLGESRRDFLQREARIPPASLAEHLAATDAHLPFKNFEYAIQTNDGSLRWAAVSGVPHQDADGNFAGYRGTGTMITERKNIARQLEDQKGHLEELVDARTSELKHALADAQSAEQAKDEFLANMSHELRTPLNAVLGMTGLARNLCVDPKQRDYLDKITASGKNLNRIINDLLDLSKIAGGHMEFESVTFNLRKLIQHCNSVLSHRAEDKGLSLIETIDDVVPEALCGDPMRIEQILLNLIGNAIKFTTTGHIEVRASVHEHEENSALIDIDVSDTGVGIPPEALDRLFKPFSQADASVSRKYGGTGLGLTISQRLAEMMGGHISVVSREGAGTTFKVRIRLVQGGKEDLPSPLSSAEALPASYQGAHVLVTDDQPLNCEIVEALLAAVGITPQVAQNGQEALDILRAAGPNAFDLVLMDVQMPVMDGVTATRALRSMAEFKSLPIIAMTAHTLAHEQESNAAAGMNDHIGKPFDNTNFYRTLAKWIPAQKHTFAHTPEKAVPEPVAEPVAEKKAGLSALSDIDTTAGLARFGNNETRYRHWLAEFVTTAGGVCDQIHNEITSGQVDTAAKTTHTFKGRVGMLGMVALHSNVTRLEHALRDGLPTEVLLSELAQSVAQMRAQLETVLSTTRDAGISEPPRAKPVLEQVIWNESYSVGVPEMDAQHKKLVAMINQLAEYQSATQHVSAESLHQVLSGMFDYTQVHFAAEEEYLRSIAYPQCAGHEKEHAAFLEKATQYCFAADNSVPDYAAVHHYLKDWLLTHILKSDMQYRIFNESKKSG
jgi:hemerythrin-like metal-binding protein/PAS domain S-box-containing protein